jgi:hypothetical protein
MSYPYEWNVFNLEPKAANFVEGFQEEIKEKYTVDKQCTVYLGGKEREKIEYQCKTYKIPVTVKHGIRFPKKYPTANINLLLTPGFYVANAIINKKHHKALIFCDQNHNSEAYIPQIPTDSIINNLYLNQLNYLFGPNDDNKIKRKSYDHELIDFIESTRRTNEIKKQIETIIRDSKPKVIDRLADLLSKEIKSGAINQKYINEINGYKSAQDYLYHTIYRILLINASLLPNQSTQSELRNKMKVYDIANISQNFGYSDQNSLVRILKQYSQ